MIRLDIIGNLGADAEKRVFNGREFISFKVYHSQRSVNRDTGEVISENVIVASCTYNRPSDAILPYLKRGQKVYCSGAIALRCYSSPTTKKWEAGLNLFVDHIELVGSKVELNDEQRQAINWAQQAVEYLKQLGYDSLDEIPKKKTSKK